MAATTIQAAVEAHRAALAATDPVEDLANPLHDVERKAWTDLVACPCLTPADVDAKLSYLLDDERMRDWIADDTAEPVTLLQSLRIPVPVAVAVPDADTSQRVNALFASYVATEAEQARLGAIGTVEASAQADALGEPAMAIRGEIFAIRDRSACPDLVAARILLDLMLSHPWPPTTDTEWGEDADLALPMLEILSGSLAGAVREQARIALATIGVHVPAEAPASIGDMTRELRALFERPATEAADDLEKPTEFEILRDRIIGAEARSPRDVALQLMADTHFGDMVMSDGFADRVKALANVEAL